MTNQQAESQRRPIKLFLLIIVALFLVIRCLYLYISDYQRFPIEVVKVESPFNFSDRKLVEKTIEPFLNHSFFTLPVHQLHQKISQLNGIEQVEIYRRWPNQLHLCIQEKIPVAIWNGSMMTASGELFDDDRLKVHLDLPRLEGSQKNKKDMLHTYQKLSKILSKYGITAEVLRYATSQGWQLKLKNDMLIKLGHQDMAIRLQQFLLKLPAIKAKSAAPIRYADLRYRHGVAIKYDI